MTNEHFDINTLTIRVYERVMTDAERLRFRPRKGDERMIGTEIKSGDGVCLLSREFVFDRVASANLQVMTRQTALFGLADLWHLGRVHFVHAPPPHPSALRRLDERYCSSCGHAHANEEPHAPDPKTFS